MSRGSKKKPPHPSRPGATRVPEVRPTRAEAAGAGGGATAIALWIVLALLVAARAALAFLPTMWAWSLNLNRFLSPVAGWALWVVAAIALVPAVSRRVVPLADGTGAFVGRSAAAPAIAAVAAAALVGLLPDRTMFVGDFIMRQGAVEMGVAPARVFPQALPLDVLLHYLLPVWVTHWDVLNANGIARVLGALDAALLAVAAITFARALALERAAAVATAAVVFFGGYLGMFTGYGKAVVELVPLTALTGAFGLRAVREGRGLLGLGITLAAAFALHRAALGLIPAAALAWILWFRRHGGGAWRRPAVIAAIAIPVVALALVGPKIVRTLIHVDAPIHLEPASARTEGVVAAAFAGTRVPDFLNLLFLFSPIALAAPFLLSRAVRGRRAELALLVTLALPLVAVIPFIHAAQGLYRDWDNFAFGGAATSLVVAWLVGETLRAGARPWLAVAVIAGVAVPSLQWLAHYADLERGLARAEAFMTEPPRRTDTDRAGTWDFIGLRNFRLDRYAEAGRALGHAAETAPSPRILLELAMSETRAENFGAAQAAYRRMLGRDSTLVYGWRGLATVSARNGDFDEARRAAERTLQLSPDDRDARAVLQYLDQVHDARR